MILVSLLLEVLIKDKPFNLEFKISDKDKAILYLADVVDRSVMIDQPNML